MPKTPEQMIALYGQWAAASKAAAEVAFASANLWLAAANLEQCFTNRLMQGLIGWRVGSASPAVPFKAAVDALRGHGLPPKEANELPLAQAAVISFLAGEPWGDILLSGLTADRLLDGVLAISLRGESDTEAWERGISQLRKMKGTALALETYSVYARLLNAHGDEVENLVGQAGRLFARRAKDAFYFPVATQGGGPDNKYTVDFQLAAILKKIDYAGDSLHRWRWD